jgi:import inner membrane translocase subunit TIM17
MVCSLGLTREKNSFDCAVKGIRRKEDPYNAIIAGFFTGGALAIRGGYKAARNGAIGCAVLLAVIEGVGIGFQKMLAGSTKLEVRIFLVWRCKEREPC